jgi:AraC-like DNA-binding protein
VSQPARRGLAVPVRGGSAPATVLLACTTRDRPRQLLTRAFPRGRAQVRVVRDADALDDVLASTLVDAIVVDLAHATAGSGAWRALEHATRYAPIPAVGLIPHRVVEPSLLARLHAAGASTILVDGVDDAMIRVMLQPILLSSRFAVRADVLLAAHDVGPMADAVWRTGVSHVGRLTSVAAVARQLGYSREHLARALQDSGAPGPKQLLELVRLLVVQTQLAAGVPVARAAARLGYSSVSHLARAARTATGLTPGKWGDLTPEALIAAAVRRSRDAGAARSRGPIKISDPLIRLPRAPAALHYIARFPSSRPPASGLPLTDFVINFTSSDISLRSTPTSLPDCLTHGRRNHSPPR